MNTIISSEAKRAIDLAYKEHWRFRVVGHGELPKEPSYKDQWWFIPTADPEHGKDRIDVLRRAGVRFKGIVVAHEAPRMLVAPKEPDFKINPSPSIPATNKSTGDLASGLAMGLVLLISVVFQALLLDPALIVVLEDGTWLEVTTWYEPITS
jgi:hypothetical protein